MENILKTRFNDLFLDVRVAQKNILDEGKPQVNVVDAEQNKTSRQLLSVEKQALLEKDLNNKAELNLQLSVNSQLDAEVERRLLEDIQDIDHLYNKVLGIDEVMPTLLDAIGVRAATISKIEPLAGEMSWFYNDLMRLVNQPKYKRVDSKGKVILVDSLRAGLSFFGLDNLIQIVTSLSFRRWLPQITDPYPKIKVRIWEEALATALCCKQIATISKVDPNHAFCIGMLQLCGKIVITRKYFRIFEEVQREALIETETYGKHEEHKALRTTRPNGEFLNILIEKHAFNISTKLIVKMDMKRVFISQPMQELQQNLPDSELSPMALVLKQGSAYAKYRILKQHKLIDLPQAKEFVRSMKLPKGALELLKTTDIRTLQLTTSNN
ncbi:HDOD domain-containing protein [Paraglaciecola sp. L3A3]|uniref:HDOD domain-containing protein n=1 Tax=Paraglaciecola sp. L3A3 TaxID=2686358 RepID=UPI00131C6B52|nr:HDOD domain-containing protein [Paraglaciecola sp. L3A3]